MKTIQEIVLEVDTFLANELETLRDVFWACATYNRPSTDHIYAFAEFRKQYAEKLIAVVDQERGKEALAGAKEEREKWKEAWDVAMEVIDGYAGDPPQAAFEKLKHMRGKFDAT